MSNLTVENLEKNPKPLSYYFEYKQEVKSSFKTRFCLILQFQGNTRSDWVSFGQIISIDSSQNILLQNLEPETTYVVRAIIIPSDIPAANYLPSYVKETKFTTPCKCKPYLILQTFKYYNFLDVTSDDITWSSKNTSVEITINLVSFMNITIIKK